jgi:hypothetical protein
MNLHLDVNEKASGHLVGLIFQRTPEHLTSGEAAAS